MKNRIGEHVCMAISAVALTFAINLIVSGYLIWGGVCAGIVPAFIVAAAKSSRD